MVRCERSERLEHTEGSFNEFVSENERLRTCIAQRPAVVLQMLAARGY